MIEDIKFPKREKLYEGRVFFKAAAGDIRMTCVISVDTLRDHFGADVDDPLPAFKKNRRAIEKTAATLIIQGRFEADATIVIRKEDFKS